MQNVSEGLAISTLATYLYTVFPTEDELIIPNYKLHEETICMRRTASPETINMGLWILRSLDKWTKEQII